MPPQTNRNLAFTGTRLRLEKRAPTAPTCRLAILEVLTQLPGPDNDVITVDRILDLLTLEGIGYPRSTVYKAMRRMSNAEDASVRVTGGFRTMAPI